MAEPNRTNGNTHHNKDTTTHGQSTPVVQQGRSECSCMHACAVQHMHQAICYAWVAARKEACTYLHGMNGGWHPTPRSSHVQAETHLKGLTARWLAVGA
jgi:hypothetical protein